MSDQHLLTRVRKLLAKAEDPAVTEAEAEAYNTKAAELIARYGIDRAVLAAAGRHTDTITSVKIPLHNPYSKDKAQLLSCVADPLRCRVVLLCRGQAVQSVTVFGFRSDLDRVELLFTSLLLQATTQLAKVRPGWAGQGQTVAAYRRTWLAGFASAVRLRLQAAESRAVAEHEGHSAELVVLDRKKLVNDAYDAQYGRLRKASPRHLSGTGYTDGHFAGRRANLGTTHLKGGGIALPARTAS
ncbi:DUF2786 domain-containing protein [Amycolatopsis sp. 195334CR]|uniref:DUF2786 domain-containing protein n=1 Tax=Amycolatopsis sp. 195334CR TaxID=2814588 RepID=UPI001A906608|nr:DUF2786 domain-containing protein [Amycolatopsis sp. 195334CR]MBN6034790.1 DUF2786 domain-containing protein [Amycolatopsis sp. 195334CR]